MKPIPNPRYSTVLAREGKDLIQALRTRLLCQGADTVYSPDAHVSNFAATNAGILWSPQEITQATVPSHKSFVPVNDHRHLGCSTKHCAENTFIVDLHEFGRTFSVSGESIICTCLPWPSSY